MTVRIPWAARWDILDAADAYETKVPRLGQRFISSVDAAIRMIERTPRAYSAAPGIPSGREVRFRLVHRFPYAVYYEVTAADIVILAVIHVRRRQRTWRSRL